VCFTRFSQSGVSVGFVFPPGGDGDRPNEYVHISLRCFYVQHLSDSSASSRHPETLDMSDCPSAGPWLTPSSWLAGWTVTLPGLLRGSQGWSNPHLNCLPLITSHSDYVPPTAYSGPQITVFNNLTRKDGGGQRIVFRCQVSASSMGRPLQNLTIPIGLQLLEWWPNCRP
jgi:hypothetical protein